MPLPLTNMSSGGKLPLYDAEGINIVGMVTVPDFKPQVLMYHAQFYILTDDKYVLCTGHICHDF